MQSLRQNAASSADRSSQQEPSSHTMDTVRIEALANLPISEREPRERMTGGSMSTGLNSHGFDVHDVVVPPSPRVPLMVRSRATRAGRWRSDVLAEWVKLHSQLEDAE